VTKLNVYVVVICTVTIPCNNVIQYKQKESITKKGKRQRTSKISRRSKARQGKARQGKANVLRSAGIDDVEKDELINEAGGTKNEKERRKEKEEPSRTINNHSSTTVCFGTGLGGIFIIWLGI
jgi:hypothetical protein